MRKNKGKGTQSKKILALLLFYEENAKQERTPRWN